MNVEEAIAETAARVSNWGRWGIDDVLGTLNFVEPEHVTRAAGLVRRGQAFPLGMRFDGTGPQRGWRNRVNPIHLMTDTGEGAASGTQGFPHGIGGADDAIYMPLGASTHWDGLGHIFDHGTAWNGRRSNEVVTAAGDAVTGVEHMVGRIVGRGVLLDVGRVVSGGELADGFGITAEHLGATITAQGASSTVGRGDFLLVRTGHLGRARRDGWGTFAGGDAPGLSFATAEWLHRTEIAAVAADTWGLEVRPNEFEGAFQPFHQVAIPHMGLLLGEMFDLDGLAADCAADGVYEFLFVAAGLPVTGAVNSPVNPLAVK
jgi:kynurenine formamidase